MTRTNSEQMAGVAMVPAVIRDGVVKGHLVFGAPFVLPLTQLDDSLEFRRALYLVAHECGHVADLKRKDLAFPGTLLQWRPERWDDAVLLVGATAAWDEYAACRASAFFDRSVAQDHAENVCAVLPAARSIANQHIIEYRIHGDLFLLVETAGQALAEAILAVFPEAEVQSCTVRLLRDCLAFASHRKHNSMARALREPTAPKKCRGRVEAIRGNWSLLKYDCHHRNSD